ncbi:hypothetical protein TSUD_272000 [Trifolium subterraneum]|uniref:Integrase catalytic domain-containing protein n=1 Tax=Trifolium subterraneum TaxID=3900 RepID=A0A2Z6NCR5_TRISU|nr:hypothetical protein TSUD_272000 [Trifolium subterraneum]
MKLYLLEEGLREGTKFQEAVGIVEMETLDEFFELAQRYIKWEEKQKASEVRRPNNFEDGGPSSQREERRGDEKKREGGKVREAKPLKSQFTYHTPLKAPRDKILSEISNAEFKSAGIRFPKQLPAKPYVDKKKFYRFHKSYGHVTDDCVHLKDAIEILIQKGYARQYVDGQPRTTNNPPRQNQLAVDPASPEQNVEDVNRAIGGVALAISRPEDFLPLPNNEEKEALDYLSAHLDGSWENFPGAQVISGGGINPVTIGSIKRKFDELEKASPVGEIKITKVKESSVPLAFYREEVPGEIAKLSNSLARLFKVLQLTEENLVPYVGSDLQGFNGSTTKPWGYVDLIVTFGENKAMKSVKVKFLVVDCPSLYNCIIGRPTFAELFIVSSTIHLKLKYYTNDGQKKKEEAKLPGVNSINTEDAVELDAQNSKKERKQEKKAMKDDLLIKENYRPIPYGEFELVPLGEDPTKGVKIGADLPDLVKRQLKACLRENAELFAWSAAKMPGRDPEVACHQLTIDPRASAVVQRHRKQSPEKAEAAKKPVKDLLEANFIAEAQYTTWLSNVILVKKSNGKWHQPVKQLLARPDMVGRMLKWSLELSEFDISFETIEFMHIYAIGDQSWMALVYNFLKSNILPADAKEAAKIRKRACSYILIDDKLYRRGFSIPLLKCVEEMRVEFILQEIHEGINGQHIGGRSLARKALRAGYYWPTMQNDVKDHVLKCDKCRRHGDMHIAPANELKTLISPWPFAWWGMDILGPFPTASRQVKYLIVVVDYFTKLIEAEPHAKIGATHILRFFKRNMLARFEIPQVEVTDNGTQFTNKTFQEFLATIGTTQYFTTTPHSTTGETPFRHNVLWSYRTTPHSTTGETPFRLTYGIEAVIPVETGEPYPRIEYPHEEDINDELLREELDLVEELRTGASLREATLKQKIAARHDKRVIKREFEVGSLVLRRNQKDSREGKLAANWEGPYRVRAKTENGAYHLEDVYGKEIPRILKLLKLDPSSNAGVHAQRGNTPCELHRCSVHARQNTQLAMGYSMPRGKSPNDGAFLDSSLGASQTLVQFHKLLGNGAYDPRHQEATVIVKRTLAQRGIYLANRTFKETKLKP